MELVKSKAITIENTNKCCISCVFCPREKCKYKNDVMDNDLFKRIIDQSYILGIRHIDMGGYGDPYMDPDLGWKLKYIKSNYKDVSIYLSNVGFLMNEKYDSYLEYIDVLKISNYSCNKENFEKMHGVNYEITIENICRILELKNRPYINALMVVNEDNIREIEDWKSWWNAKADEIMVWRPHNYKGYNTCGTSSCITAIHSCGRPQNGSLFVHADGSVSPCCFDINKEIIIGNLMKEDLITVLKGEKRTFYIDIHSKNDLYSINSTNCKGCDQLSDRSDALIFASNKRRKVGVLNSSPTYHNILED